MKAILFLYTPLLCFSLLTQAKESKANRLSFNNEKGVEVVSYDLPELKKKYKVEKVSVYNYITQEIETYNTFDLGKLLDQIYGRNKWRNGYAIGTISTDKYAPIIKKQVYANLKPYLAFERADGSDFVIKKSFSKGNISLAPYYIIWKIPKAMGNLKKVRDHWPWKISDIYVLPKEPTELIPSSPKFNLGKETFINHCIACHTINGSVGGSKGGDLAKLLTKNPRSDVYLNKFIFKPREVNPKSRMPHFPVYLDKKEIRIKRRIKYLRDKIKF